MTDQNMVNPWADDLLGYAQRGDTFTKLIQTVDDSKVISIEAGFGHGKTFFRTAWAKQLRQAGEVVIEVDAQKSDHSGDPVVTFLGALLAALPEIEKGNVEKTTEALKKYGGVAIRSAAHMVLRAGAEEAIEALSGEVAEAFEGQEALQGIVNDVGDQMSKTASQLIAGQLAVEKAMAKELPDQLKALRVELTKGAETDRVIILIDELDRCHPEYAISLLETMKHIFDIDGYVFCLMVNADYLEKVAQHRFGSYGDGERYLDKFVDLRLSLGATSEAKGAATQQLAMNLPLGTPYGIDPAFSVEAAAELAGKMAANSGLSFRQIKRVLDRVEIALRCYAETPLDCSLLVYLAFKHLGVQVDEEWLPRAKLTPDEASRVFNPTGIHSRFSSEDETGQLSINFVRENCAALLSLENAVYRMPPLPQGSGDYFVWAKVLQGLGPRYIPEHEAVLDAVHDLLAPERK
jgi:hypothetical protein